MNEWIIPKGTLHFRPQRGGYTLPQQEFERIWEFPQIQREIEANKLYAEWVSSHQP